MIIDISKLAEILKFFSACYVSHYTGAKTPFPTIKTPDWEQLKWVACSLQ